MLYLLFVEANTWNKNTEWEATSKHVTTYTAYIPVCTEVIPKRIKELYNIGRSVLVPFTNACIEIQIDKPATLGNLLLVVTNTK